jgi:hypothetical protein
LNLKLRSRFFLGRQKNGSVRALSDPLSER